MSDDTIQQRYNTLIDEIVTATLKGQIRSEAQIYERLVRDIEAETNEIFEQILKQRLQITQAQAKDNSDELKQAKAMRSFRALERLEKEWQRFQTQQQTLGAIAAATQAILAAVQTEQPLIAWIQATDPNQTYSFTLEDLKQLAQSLERLLTLSPATAPALQAVITGTRRGIEASQKLEGFLFQWMYEPQRQAGFEQESSNSRGPWSLWASQSQSTLLRQLFHTLASNQSLVDWARQYPFDQADLVELTIVLRTLQRRLVTWFEQQPYDSRLGTQATIATFLTFAVIWGQLSQGMDQPSGDRRILEQGCFQALLQLLRRFAQHPAFPLYGGVFALFSGQQLQDTLSYLDAPLRRAAGTQEKARILTLLGYSQRAVGLYDRAIGFHQQALEIAQMEADHPCEIANLNHLSRIYIARKQYSEALGLSQRALILARQTGDTLGKAHALTNVGYAEIFSARAADVADSEVYETAIAWLQQGLNLSETLGDRQCQSLCHNSLGVAYVALEQYETAIPHLEKGVEFAQSAGDLYLQGLNFTYLAEAYYGLGDRSQALYAACLATYLLAQIQSTDWRQPAGLWMILQGQLGDEAMQSTIAAYRSKLIALIGVDGYDHLPDLLNEYKRSIG